MFILDFPIQESIKIPNKLDFKNFEKLKPILEMLK